MHTEVHPQPTVKVLEEEVFRKERAQAHHSIKHKVQGLTLSVQKNDREEEIKDYAYFVENQIINNGIVLSN